MHMEQAKTNRVALSSNWVLLCAGALPQKASRLPIRRKENEKKRHATNFGKNGAYLSYLNMSCMDIILAYSIPLLLMNFDISISLNLQRTGGLAI